METFLGWSRKTQMTETTSIVWIELSSTWKIGMIVQIWGDHIETFPDDWGDRNIVSAIPEIFTLISVIGE